MSDELPTMGQRCLAIWAHIKVLTVFSRENVLQWDDKKFTYTFMQGVKGLGR